MAASQIGKVPGASPRNPTDARSREAKEKEKEKWGEKYLKYSERRLRVKPDSGREACWLIPTFGSRGITIKGSPKP